MRFDLDAIKAITVGALDVFEENGGFSFLKMTEKQSQRFREFSETLYERSLTTTGIRLDFHTDSPYLRFAVLSSGRYEIALDGLLSPDNVIRESGCAYEVALPKDGATHRVTLYLPSHSCGSLAYLELADGSKCERHIFDRKILFLGDSITQGWNAEYDSLSFAYQTSEILNAESMIQGVGGAFYDAGFVGEIGFSPDSVIVAYGTNDANRVKKLDEFEEICSRYFERVKALYPSSTLYVITPIWRQDYDLPRPYGHVRLISESIARIADSYRAKVIDGMTLMPHLPCMMADVLHPNALGFSLYAKALVQALGDQ